MASINDIVTVTVVNAAKGITQEGFGTLLFIMENVPEGVKNAIAKKTPTKTFGVVRVYESLSALIEDGFTPPKTDTKGDIAYLAAQVYFGQTPSPTKILIAPKDKDWSTTLSGVSNVNDDWYALATYSHLQADVEQLAKEVASRQRIYFYSTNDQSKIFKSLMDSSQERAAGLYSAQDSLFPECGWLSSGLAMDPGTITYCYKNIKGITVDKLSTTESSSINALNGNTYETIAGQNVTRYGKVANGNYIDIVMGIDWITARIKENVYSLLVNSPKVPFSDAGITAIQNKITEILNMAMDKLIVSDYSIKMPKASKVTPEDEAKRLLDNIDISLTMCGAIQTVKAKIIYQL